MFRYNTFKCQKVSKKNCLAINLDRNFVINLDPIE